MIITGLDLSLASTGLARITLDQAGRHEQVELQRLRGPLPKWPANSEAKRPIAHNLGRMDKITREILAWTEGSDWVALEGPSFGSARPGQARGHWERGGLWWHIRLELYRRDVPVAQIPPTCNKIYCTGSGKADKREMQFHVQRRFPWAEVDGEDKADAFGLALMCAHHLGHPLAPMPKTHTRGLAGCSWPESQPGRQANLGELAPLMDARAGIQAELI